MSEQYNYIVKYPQLPCVQYGAKFYLPFVSAVYSYLRFTDSNVWFLNCSSLYLCVLWLQRIRLTSPSSTSADH